MLVLVLLIYVTAFLFFSEVMLATYNFFAFLIKQRKYKTWPLLAFYVLALFLSAIRTLNYINYFKDNLEVRIADYMLAPILNINLGLVQCWMLIELSMRIQQNISVTN